MKFFARNLKTFTPAEESPGSVASMSSTKSYERVLRAFVARVGRIGPVVTGGRRDAWSDKSPGAHAWINGQAVGELHPGLAHVYRSYD
jgi:hypothetical protein